MTTARSAPPARSWAFPGTSPDAFLTIGRERARRSRTAAIPSCSSSGATTRWRSGDDDSSPGASLEPRGPGSALRRRHGRLRHDEELPPLCPPNRTRSRSSAPFGRPDISQREDCRRTNAASADHFAARTTTPAVRRLRSSVRASGRQPLRATYSPRCSVILKTCRDAQTGYPMAHTLRTTATSARAHAEAGRGAERSRRWPRTRAG